MAVAIKVLQERIGRYRPQRVSPDEIAYHILVPQRPAQLFILNHESVKLEIKFKEAAKAQPINIEMLTKGKTNGTTHIKRANAAETGRG